MDVPADNVRSGAGDILIVGDTPANLRLLFDMLVEEGYRVRVAPNGELALRNARAAVPELILLDIAMPGLSGYEVCAQLKADQALRAVPVLFLSAMDQPEDIVRAFAGGEQRDDVDFESLIQAADQSLYGAKQAGRNRVQARGRGE